MPYYQIERPARRALHRNDREGTEMYRTLWKQCLALCAVLGLCLTLAACGAGPATAADEAGEEASGMTAAAHESGAVPGGAQEGSALTAQLPQDGRRLIMNAELTVEALDFDQTLAALRAAADEAGGYLSSTYLEGGADSGARYAHCEFRIPVERYDSFLTAADGTGNVTQKSESVQDVTAQYVDVEARLASLETQRESLNAMLAQAQDIETLLAVQSELADVQYQIESYTAKKRAYDDQTAYSTVQVTVHEVRRMTENPQGFASRLGAAFRSGWHGLGQGVQSMAVGLAAMLPALLVLAAVGCAVWAAVRMLLRRRAKRPRTPGPGPRGPMAPRGATEQKAPAAPPAGPEKNGPGEERPHGI